LLSFLNHDSFSYIAEVIRALTALGSKFRGIHFPRPVILAYVFKEIDYFNYLKKVAYRYNTSDDAAGIPALVLFVKALEEKCDRSLEKICMVLGLLYGIRDMSQAYRGLKSKNSQMNANTIEFLDTILSLKLKKVLVPIAEEYSHSGSCQRVKPVREEQHINDSSLSIWEAEVGSEGYGPDHNWDQGEIR